MSTPERYVVADLGYAFAVHDTKAPAEYPFEAGKDKEHKSTNKLNTSRVDIFPTKAEAVRLALELNRR